MRGRIGIAVGVALVLVGGGPSPAGAAAERRPVLDAARFSLTAGQRAIVENHVERAPVIARRLARLAAPHLTFRVSRAKNTSRAHQVPMADGPIGARYVVELDPAALRPGARGRLVVLHELGHIVDWAFVDRDLRSRFDAAFSASTSARDCYAPRGGVCAGPAEVFADQFAFWAGARRGLRSPYRVPPLLSRSAFGSLIAAAGWSPDSPLRVTPR